VTKKKLIIALSLLVILSAGGAYETVLKPKPKVVIPKVNGTLVSLGDPFTLNLAGGHYGRLSVSVLVTKAPVPTPTSSGTSLVLPENDVVRAIVTNDLTGIDSSRLIDRPSREALAAEILRDLKKSTDESVTQVLFTDLAVE
jgi:flagellar basal body-associated protein FliL